MGYVWIVKAPENVQNGICFPDICKKLVSKPFSFASSLYQTRYVHNFHRCRHHVSRMHHIHQRLKPLVRHRRGAYLRIDCAERKIRRLSLGGADAVEKRALPYIRESYYATFYRHEILVLKPCKFTKKSRKGKIGGGQGKLYVLATAQIPSPLFLPPWIQQ